MLFLYPRFILMFFSFFITRHYNEMLYEMLLLQSVLKKSGPITSPPPLSWTELGGRRPAPQISTWLLTSNVRDFELNRDCGTILAPQGNSGVSIASKGVRGASPCPKTLEKLSRLRSIFQLFSLKN